MPDKAKIYRVRYNDGRSDLVTAGEAEVSGGHLCFKTLATGEIFRVIAPGHWTEFTFVQFDDISLGEDE